MQMNPALQVIVAALRQKPSGSLRLLMYKGSRCSYRKPSPSLAANQGASPSSMGMSFLCRRAANQDSRFPGRIPVP